MTRNQIEYRSILETERANKAKESENERSNLAKEAETHRSNVANETETNRSNVARETETHRSNVVKEKETNRSNKAKENLGLLNYSEAVRHNKTRNTIEFMKLPADYMKAAGSLIPKIG